MINKDKVKTIPYMQEATVRRHSFGEVTETYTKEQAHNEAERCLDCKTKPCVAGCPVDVDIPGFIEYVKLNMPEKAFDLIAESNNMPSICGRVCPQENQCEKYCIRGNKGEPVAIGRLERYVGDVALSTMFTPKARGKKVNCKVAVIGSGPSGLACAYNIAMAGGKVDIYEAFHESGGVLIYGIPEFRLPKEIVKKEIQKLKSIGVTFIKNAVVGKSHKIEEMLQQGYDAVYISSGAGLPKMMPIEGINLNGVYSANEFLTRINLMKAYRYPEVDTPVHQGKKVAVIGGGNVAMDAARCALRLGAEEVNIVYRRSIEEFPARQEEVHHALDEGVGLKLQLSPCRIIGDEKGWVTYLECYAVTLSEEDETGRKAPVINRDQVETIEADCVILAIGQTPNPIVTQSLKSLDIEAWGGIRTDDQGRTNLSGVYAGGDIVTGAATVIEAMGAGKRAAKAIVEDLGGTANDR